MSFSDKSCYHELLVIIARTWLITKQKAKVMLSEMNYDLTFEQIMVLHILEEQEGLNLRDVAERADRERTTISRMVDGLEKRNLVVKVPDKIDKRQKLLYLTHLGKERLEQIIPMGEKFRRDIYQGLSKSDVELCLATLKRVIGNSNKQ